jgi:hypothetical protein
VALNEIEGSAESPPVDRREKMNRIRVGLTGLAVVLVLVFIATAVITRINGSLQQPMNASAKQAANAAAADEPLANLGVAPGASNASVKEGAKP